MYESTFRELDIATRTIEHVFCVRPYASGALVCGTALLGGDVNLVACAIESLGLTNSAGAALIAQEGFFSAAKEKIVHAINVMSGGVLKVTNTLMELGRKLDRTVAKAVTIPAEKITGKTVPNPEVVGKVIEGMILAAGIALAYYSKAPTVIKEYLEKAAVNPENMSVTRVFLQKVNQFKWPFGVFNAKFNAATRKLSVSFQKLGKAGGEAYSSETRLSFSAWKGILDPIAEVSSSIQNLTKGALKASAQIASELRSALMRPVTQYIEGANGSGSLVRKVVAYGAIIPSFIAVTVGFIGRVFISGIHYVNKWIHDASGGATSAEV